MAQKYQCPYFVPYTEPGFYGTWIYITSHTLMHQTALAGGTNPGGLVLNDKIESSTWKYLAPQQIMESINNTWEPWETISSRLAGKGQEVLQMIESGSALATALKGQLGGIDVGKFFKNLSSVDRQKLKVDTPLVYTNTERREYTLQFNLTANESGVGRSSAHIMMQGLTDLKMFSLPTRSDDHHGLGIELPHVFSLKTIAGPEENEANFPMINIEYAVITSIQPTYMAPYDDQGYPMRIELTVTFKELSPLYSDSIISF